MIVTIKPIKEKYLDDEPISLIGSHFHHNTNEIVIDLPQVLQHSLDCNIEQAFTQHVTHELIHKLLREHEDILTCANFDNLGSEKMYRIEGKFSLRNWFGGMLDKEV